MGILPLLLIWDGLCAVLSSVFGLFLAAPQYLYRWQYILSVWIVNSICSACLGAYRPKFRQTVFTLPLRLAASSFFAGFLLFYFLRESQLPPSAVILTFLPLCALTLAGRLLLSKDSPHSSAKGRAVIYGAGELGRLLADRLLEGEIHGPRPAFFLDDDPSKKGQSYRKIPIAGDLCALQKLSGVDCLIIAIQHLSPRKLREASQLASALGIPLKRFGLFDQQEGIQSARLGEIPLEELLRREPVSVDLAPIRSLLEGKTVLVTGGAGSIGSELCRQVLRLGAAHLVALDIGENSLFALGRELKEQYPSHRFALEIGSVRDPGRMRQLMEQYHPAIVLHAAAHKHVPMMESCPAEAVKNNLLGTKIAAEAAIQARAQLFVLISTDKAVNPTSVMGASKRGAELVLQQLWSQTSSTRLCAVRFGNVLGSQGSVVPIFQQQIAQGGPVTITHREMRRYFMTIPEAVQLVLSAAALSQGGETFVLDMGEPVSIYDLACDMIRLSGYRPHQDIAISFTGPRPGEKLTEELELPQEKLHPTACSRISAFSWDQAPPPQMEETIAQLRLAAEQGSDFQIHSLLQKLIPTYTLQAGKTASSSSPQK